MSVNNSATCENDRGGYFNIDYFSQLVVNERWLSLVDILAAKDPRLSGEAFEHGTALLRKNTRQILNDTQLPTPDYRREILEGLQSITPRGGSALMEGLLIQESEEICNMDPSSLTRSVSTFLSSVHSTYVPKEIRHTLIFNYTLRLNSFKDVSECEDAIVALEQEMSRPCNQVKQRPADENDNTSPVHQLTDVTEILDNCTLSTT